MDLILTEVLVEKGLLISKTKILITILVILNSLIIIIMKIIVAIIIIISKIFNCWLLKINSKFYRIIKINSNNKIKIIIITTTIINFIFSHLLWDHLIFPKKLESTTKC